LASEHRREGDQEAEFELGEAAVQHAESRRGRGISRERSLRIEDHAQSTKQRLRDDSDECSEGKPSHIRRSRSDRAALRG
jgi:hypothetical protein